MAEVVSDLKSSLYSGLAAGAAVVVLAQVKDSLPILKNYSIFDAAKANAMEAVISVALASMLGSFALKQFQKILK